MSRAPDVLQVEEDVLKPLAASTHICGTNLDFQWNRTSTKGKAVALTS